MGRGEEDGSGAWRQQRWKPQGGLQKFDGEASDSGKVRVVSRPPESYISKGGRSSRELRPYSWDAFTAAAEKKTVAGEEFE